MLKQQQGHAPLSLNPRTHPWGAADTEPQEDRADHPGRGQARAYVSHKQVLLWLVATMGLDGDGPG